ncbi:SH3 domain-containing protein [Streptomyces sp. NPDC015144]|uniref:SH3 domain-containing protein n=1 Tax=Streptomyces sp. NPDC015144 TaxID=3364944 RepID=UPI0036FB1123
MNKRYLGVLLAAGVTAAGLMVPATAQATAPAAKAGNCRAHAHSAKDNVTRGKPSKSSVPLRSAGPYADCSIDGYVADSVTLVYHCTTTNDLGSKWTWVRIPGAEGGWIYNENLSPKGTSKTC